MHGLLKKCWILFNMKNICFVILIVSLLISCTDKSSSFEVLNREDLFLLNYGKFEDEIILFNDEFSSRPGISMAMQNGFFFLSDGQSRKIMQLTSFGDLLSVIYNEDYNTQPSFVTENEDTVRSTKKASIYPFNQLGKIAVDEKKSIYIVDKLPSVRHEQDKDTMAMLNEVVLHFSANGEFINYIGQNGPGGKPFSYIRDIFTVANGELVVVSVTQKTLQVDWFSESGFLKYNIILDRLLLPNPHSDNKSIYPELDNVIPDYHNDVIYLKIDFFEKLNEPNTHIQSDVAYLETQIFPLDIKTGKYKAGINIPPYEQKIETGFGSNTFLRPYDFLGVTENGYFFLISPDIDNGFTLQVANSKDKNHIEKYHLAIPNDKMTYNVFSLSKDGVISAVLAGEFEANVVWWRLDKIFGGI